MAALHGRGRSTRRATLCRNFVASATSVGRGGRGRAAEHAMVLPRALLWPGTDHHFGWRGAPVPARVDGHRGHAPRPEPLASSAAGQSFGRTRAMKPNRYDETADRAAEERSEDGGMPEHPSKARDPARWAAERQARWGQRAPEQRGPGTTGMA